MRLQERDKQIMTAIYLNEGILAVRQIHAWFWHRKSLRAVQRRLSILIKSEYLNRPTRRDYKTRPIPEPVCFLDWKGVLVLAGLMGVVVKPPKTISETQLRILQKELRKQSVRWVREPRWSLLRHDLAVTDFRMAIEQAVHDISELCLEGWMADHVFRSDTDVVEYQIKKRDGRILQKKKGIIPDAYFELIDENRQAQGEPAQARFLLEMDMATHDTNRFCSEKAIPGIKYINSSVYRQRFGSNNGYWLFVLAIGV